MNICIYLYKLQLKSSVVRTCDTRTRVQQDTRSCSRVRNMYTST